MLLFLIATALAADDASTDFGVDATSFTLPNGLVVVLDENKRTDEVALWLHYGVGARDERPGEFGCAHLFEHMMFEGSKNVPGTSFDDWLTAAGGSNNAYTSEDETAYYQTFPSGALDLALMIESDRMAFLDAGLTQPNLDNQQSVVLQERARGFDQPNGRDWDALSVLQFPVEHPYGHSVIGTIDDVSNFELDAVTDFWKRHYRPSNGILVLSGNIDAAHAKQRVEFWFKDVEDKDAPGRAERVDFAFSPRNGMLDDDVEDRTLYLSWGTVPHGHPDGAALDLLSYVLSYGRGTRLSDALYYDSKLATDEFVYNYPMEHEGVFIVGATTTKGSLKPLRKAVGKVVDELVANPPSADELERARRAKRASMLDNLEAPLDRAGELAWCQRVHGRPDCFDDEWKAAKAVTTDDLVRVAQTYFTDERLTTLSVVPRGGKGVLAGAVPVELP